MWGALFYKVYSGFADNLFEMLELTMLFLFDLLEFCIYLFLINGISVMS